MKRNRILVFVCIVIIGITGLFSRMEIVPPSVFKTYGGDCLWASLVYFICAFCKPCLDRKKVALYSILFSFCIEFSQMLTWDWLVTLRATPMRYLLGQGFLWSDLLCYCVGILFAWCLDTYMLRKRGYNRIRSIK